MIMPPRLRKFALTLHVTASVGWFGAVAGFLALALAGLTSQDAQMMRSVYPAMGLITSFVIVPLCLASLLSGVISSLGTEWGLFKHYWVTVKLLITILSTLILLIHTQPIGTLASAAQATTLPAVELNRLQIQMVVTSGATLLVLFVLTLLSVYKPRGMTPYGWRKQFRQSMARQAADAEGKFASGDAR